jgi:hypothetical protein
VYVGIVYGETSQEVDDEAVSEVVLHHIDAKVSSIYAETLSFSANHKLLNSNSIVD